jgi:hypothetical protein
LNAAFQVQNDSFAFGALGSATDGQHAKKMADLEYIENEYDPFLMMNWWHLGLRMDVDELEGASPAPLPSDVFCRGAEIRGLPPATPIGEACWWW